MSVFVDVKSGLLERVSGSTTQETRAWNDLEKSDSGNLSYQQWRFCACQQPPCENPSQYEGWDSVRNTKSQHNDHICPHVLLKVCMDVIMHRTCLNLKSINYWHYFLLTWYSCSCGAEAVFSPQLFCTFTFHVHTFTFLYLSEIIPTMKYSVVCRWLSHNHWKTSWYFQLMSLSFSFSQILQQGSTLPPLREAGER